MRKRILLGAALAALFAAPAFAQSYTAAYGTGNVMDQPLAEKTNGVYGYGGGPVPTKAQVAKAKAAPASGLNAFAFAPEQGKAPKRGKALHHRH
jgi:hypothetical protein